MANQGKGAIMPTAPAQGATTTPVASSGTSLTQSDIRTMARKAADYHLQLRRRKRRFRDYL